MQPTKPIDKIAVGLDIGGSSINTGLFDPNLDLLLRCRPIETATLENGEELLEGLLEVIDDGMGQLGVSRDKLAGIGIGCPGPLDVANGIILETPNLCKLNGYHLRDKIAEAAGVPIWMDNDANVFALGEASRGAGQGYPYVIGITLGTGMGWGIVLDGKVYQGATGTAAEYGLALIGEDGQTWEDRISIQGLLNTFHKLGGQADSPKNVHDLASQGDATAKKAWQLYGGILGLALSHAVNMLDPHIIVIGGAMAGAWDHFAPAMMDTLNEHIFTLPRANLKVCRSQLGDRAPLIGAASQVAF